MANQPPNDDQINRFKALARDLECNEDEAAFDMALKRLSEAPHTPKPEPVKRPVKK